jgi:hypothetical protein
MADNPSGGRVRTFVYQPQDGDRKAYRPFFEPVALSAHRGDQYMECTNNPIND